MKAKLKSTKFLSMLLCFVIVLTMLPMTALAAGTVTVGAFEVTGGTEGVDYTYADGVLTILTDKALTIKSTDPNTGTSDRILVADGVSANITLAGVSIRTVAGAAFEIADNSTGNVTVILADGTTNLLKSTRYGDAGLQKNGTNNDVGTLTIKGAGTLIAVGANGDSYKGGSAGIGGGFSWGSKGIVIAGGTVTAVGGDGDDTASGIGGSAGIGGGGNNRGTVTISGGIITAIGGAGSAGGAGIGGGYFNSGTVTITGGVVNAIGGTGAAGIGGGSRNATYGIVSAEKGYVTITGGIVTATSGAGDAQAIGDGNGAGSQPTNLSGATGIVIDGAAKTGTVYGNVTLTADYTLPSGITLTIPAGASLTIDSGVTFTNNGTVINNGAVTNNGAIINSGTFTDNGTFDGNAVQTGTPPAHTHQWAEEWSCDGTHHWHQCTAAGCKITDVTQMDGYGSHWYTDLYDETCNTCGRVGTCWVGLSAYNITDNQAKSGGLVRDVDQYWVSYYSGAYEKDSQMTDHFRLTFAIKNPRTSSFHPELIHTEKEGSERLAASFSDTKDRDTA